MNRIIIEDKELIYAIDSIKDAMFYDSPKDRPGEAMELSNIRNEIRRNAGEINLKQTELRVLLDTVEGYSMSQLFEGYSTPELYAISENLKKIIHKAITK